MEHQTLTFVDPLQLAEGMQDVDCLPVHLVSFKVTAPCQWIEKALEQKAHWWRSHASRSPFLCEVLENVKNLRPTKGRDQHLPKNTKAMVPIRVRNKVLWVMNDCRSVTLVLRPEHEEQDLSWFLQELQKDLHPEPPADAVPLQMESSEDLAESSHRYNKVPVSDDVQPLVDKTLQVISGHSNCTRVNYLPSKLGFRVLGSDGTCKLFRVTDLKRKLAQAIQHDDPEVLQVQFEKSLEKALEFLNSIGLADTAAPEPAVLMDA